MYLFKFGYKNVITCFSLMFSPTASPANLPFLLGCTAVGVLVGNVPLPLFESIDVPQT